ncbi:hypothetical protein ACFX5E_08320 [Flavobacterium sp. LS2P90]|uniref:Uncharacterized protein n=1 Tax=Flavobacterium xylosi TaxID=3230415 RepID=A0ABW6HWJ2_9FLAO
MKKGIILFFITLTSIVFGQNQKLTATKIGFVPLDCDQFLEYDQFGFYYYVKNNVLFKTNEKEYFEYKNISLGKITKVDLLNPLTVVLFYENFNTTILLDNQLNETQKINFSENQIPIMVGAIGLASQNQLWIYNNLTQQIGLFDFLKKEYNTVSIPFVKNIKKYQTDFNNFYWIDEENNWYSCDLFGKIIFKEKIPPFDSIEIINENKYLFRKDNILIYENTENDLKFEIEISEKTFKKFYYKDQILSIFTAEGITNYKITIP